VTSRKTLLPLALGLSLVTGVSPSPAEETHPARREPARVYTNDDLERVQPFRDELGARSVPAVAHQEGEAPTKPARARRGAPTSEKAGERGESYWRAAAEKLRERLRRLSDQREVLRARMIERRDDERRVLRRGRRSLSSDPDPNPALEARIATIERRMRDLEDDLADRARRAGALPGWLR
jgi:hypothetical protein